MGKYGSDQVGFLLVDGYDLLGTTTEITDNAEAMFEDTSGLGDSWPEPEAVGLKMAAFTQKGFFDDAALGVNVALNEQQGLSRILCFGLQGNTVGKKFTGYSGAMQVDFERVVSRGALHKANATYKGNGIVEEGIILHRQAAETASSGNTQGADSQDAGASSAVGASAYLQVPALTLGGYTSATVKVRHSADDVTYADLVTFDVVTATQSTHAQRKTVASGTTINRHTAMSWAYTGSGSGQSITPVVGLVRN